MSLLPAATSLATTIFSYFSPTKSPYYSVIAFSAVALTLSVDVRENYWLIVAPMFLVMAISTALALRSKPDFTSREYNNQLRFARAFGISSAVLCLAFIGLRIEPEPDPDLPERIVNSWWFWAGYAAAVGQAGLFMLYIFIYHSYESKQRGVNFIQLSLIFGTFLIAATYISVEHGGRETEPVVALLFLYLLWTICALFILGYLLRNFQLVRPEDALEKDDDDRRDREQA